MDKAESATITAKLMSWLVAVAPPVIAANITHWSATVVVGKQISKRARFAIFVGSFCIAAVIHKACEATGFKHQWAAIWLASVCTEHLLKFVYLEAGDIIKTWLKNSLNQFLKRLK